MAHNLPNVKQTTTASGRVCASYTLEMLALLMISACHADYDDETGEDDSLADGEFRDVAGVGRIQFAAGIETVASIDIPGRGAVLFHASEHGHGCSGFLPASAPDAQTNEARSGTCLSAFLALAPADTPIPLALLPAGSEQDLDADILQAVRTRRVVDAIDEPIRASDLHLAADARPQTAEVEGDFAHSCTGTDASAAHWEDVHCNLGGADHCDPEWWTNISIGSGGTTYYESHQRALFCGTGNSSGGHDYWNGTSWQNLWAWVTAAGSPSNAYVMWSTWIGSAAWERRVRATAGSGSWFHFYSKMCRNTAQGGSCPWSGS